MCDKFRNILVALLRTKEVGDVQKSPGQSSQAKQDHYKEASRHQRSVFPPDRGMNE